MYHKPPMYSDTGCLFEVCFQRNPALGLGEVSSCGALPAPYHSHSDTVAAVMIVIALLLLHDCVRTFASPMALFSQYRVTPTAAFVSAHQQEIRNFAFASLICVSNIFVSLHAVCATEISALCLLRSKTYLWTGEELLHPVWYTYAGNYLK
jgi:hypothetical protein